MYLFACKYRHVFRLGKTENCFIYSCLYLVKFIFLLSVKERLQFTDTSILPTKFSFVVHNIQILNVLLKMGNIKLMR